MQKLPSVRASAIRDAIGHLNVFEPGSEARVMSRVPEVSRKAVLDVTRTTFVEVEHDGAVLNAIVEVLGRERAPLFWAAVTEQLANRPVLRAFVSGMLKVVRINPARTVGLMITGWPLIYRDVCEPRELTSPDGYPVLRFDAIAPEVRRFPNYAHPWHGCCIGSVNITKVGAAVRFRTAPDFSWAEATFLPGKTP